MSKKVERPLKWCSIRPAFEKAGGIGLFVGWEHRFPKVLFILLGTWAIVLGPHTWNSGGE